MHEDTSVGCGFRLQLCEDAGGQYGRQQTLRVSPNVWLVQISTMSPAASGRF